MFDPVGHPNPLDLEILGPHFVDDLRVLGSEIEGQGFKTERSAEFEEFDDNLSLEEVLG
jgi:hypothetical protein